MLIIDIEKYIDKKILGCIHIGAHHAEEKSLYRDNNIDNIIWIEANPNYREIIEKNTNNEDLVIIKAIGQIKRKVKLKVSNNGQSSSILELGLHKLYHPDVFYVDEIEVDEDNMINIVNEYNIDMNKFNFLNLDVQGYEFEAIKGFGDLLNYLDYIYTEVNEAEVYENCAIIDQIDEHLHNYSFKRVATKITPYKWGDALYKKI